MRKPLINPGIIKRLKSFFAIIQDTDTATRYIPAGKYVLYKNIACHASQNIESGDTLALGTNLVTDSDGFVNCLNDGLKTKVNTSDIVNALTSTDSTKPLSAAQGKALNDTLTTLNSKLSNSVCSKRVALTTTNSVRITALNHRQGFLIFGGVNSPTENMICFINIDSRMQNPLILNLGNKAAGVAYGDSKKIINVTLYSWSDFVVLSETQFDVSTI